MVSSLAAVSIEAAAVVAFSLLGVVFYAHITMKSSCEQHELGYRHCGYAIAHIIYPYNCLSLNCVKKLGHEHTTHSSELHSCIHIWCSTW